MNDLDEPIPPLRGEGSRGAADIIERGYPRVGREDSVLTGKRLPRLVLDERVLDRAVGPLRDRIVANV